MNTSLLTMLIATVIWLFYMDMPFDTLGVFIVSFGLGWWVRGHNY